MNLTKCARPDCATNIADDTGESYCTDHQARPLGEALDACRAADAAACERIKQAVASGRLSADQVGAAVGIRAALEHPGPCPEGCVKIYHLTARLVPAGGSDV